MATVVKHNFIRGGKAIGRAKAHIRYIQYREGADREKDAPPRSFFDKDRDAVLGAELRRQIDEYDGYGVAMHRVVLSPGVNGIDFQEYTREVMDELSRQKGQELDWKAVVHENTAHHHVHICIMGKDRDGGEVRLKRNDYKDIKLASDRYLEREHYYERFLDRELHILTSREGYDRRGERFFKELFYDADTFRKVEQEREQDRAKLIPKDEWDRDQAVRELPATEKIWANDNVYSKFSSKEELLELNGYVKEAELYLKPELYDKMWTWIGVKNRAGEDFYEKEARGVKDYQDYEDFKKFEEDLRLALTYERGEIPRSVRGEQRILEQQGRLSDYHFTYTSAMQKQRLEEIAEHQPHNAEWAQKELELQNDLKNKYWSDRNVDLDKLLYGCEKPWYPWGDKEKTEEREQEELPMAKQEINQVEKSNEQSIESQTPEGEKTPDESAKTETDVRMDVIGGRIQALDDDERDADRDFYGNER